MNFRKEQLIELSHPLLVGKENFAYAPFIVGPENPADDYFQQPEHWYIECETPLGSHVGTHIEVPYHQQYGGADCSQWPIEKLVGEAVTLNVMGKKAGEAITLDDLKKYDGQIKEGDFIFLHTGFDEYFRTPEWEPWPHLTMEATEWLLSFKPKAIGTDASTIELPGEEEEETETGQPVHSAIFKSGAAIIESLTNLGAIEGIRPTVFVLSLLMEKMDASPVRILAIKDL